MPACLIPPTGVALVDAHGEALAQQLLPRFESYLNRDAAARLGLQEDRYDLVREGVVVLLGMMAGHLAPGDDKVWVAEARRECRGNFRVFLDAERPRGGGGWQLVIRTGVGLGSALQRFNCCAEYSNARTAAAGFW